jgi:Domain of unknown function (DUF4365)
MDDDAILADNDVESALSLAYVQVVAAHSGYICGEPPGPDRDSVDAQIMAGGAMRPKLDIQLKATVNLKRSDAGFSYPLKIKNYEDLRVETQTPRILVVLDLPEKKSDWIILSPDELILRKSAYWISLRGQA